MGTRHNELNALEVPYRALKLLEPQIVANQKSETVSKAIHAALTEQVLEPLREASIWHNQQVRNDGRLKDAEDNVDHMHQVIQNMAKKHGEQAYAQHVRLQRANAWGTFATAACVALTCYIALQSMGYLS
jgi:hypothetical protein